MKVQWTFIPAERPHREVRAGVPSGDAVPPRMAAKKLESACKPGSV